MTSAPQSLDEIISEHVTKDDTEDDDGEDGVDVEIPLVTGAEALAAVETLQNFAAQKGTSAHFFNLIMDLNEEVQKFFQTSPI